MTYRFTVPVADLSSADFDSQNDCLRQAVVFSQVLKDSGLNSWVFLERRAGEVSPWQMLLAVHDGKPLSYEELFCDSDQKKPTNRF